MNLWYLLDGKVAVYNGQEIDGKRSLLVQADSAEALWLSIKNSSRANTAKKSSA